MGQKFEFICPNCHYEAFVAGGFDCGMMSAFVTVACRDCRELYDVLVDQRTDGDGFEVEEGDGEEGEGIPALAGLACPKEAGHRIGLWEAAGACPRCGAGMQVGRPGPCWD